MWSATISLYHHLCVADCKLDANPLFSTKVKSSFQDNKPQKNKIMKIWKWIRLKGCQTVNKACDNYKHINVIWNNQSIFSFSLFPNFKPISILSQMQQKHQWSQKWKDAFTVHLSLLFCTIIFQIIQLIFQLTFCILCWSQMWQTCIA